MNPVRCKLTVNKSIVRKLLVPVTPKLQALLIQNVCLRGVSPASVEVAEVPVDPGQAIGMAQVRFGVWIRCPDFFEQLFIGCDCRSHLAGVGVMIRKSSKSGISLVAEAYASSPWQKR